MLSVFFFFCFLNECETWCLTFGEEHRLKAFENRVQRKKIFGTSREQVTGRMVKTTLTSSFMMCSSRQLLGWPKKDGWEMWHIWKRGRAHSGFQWGILMERDYLLDLAVDGRIILKRIFKKKGRGVQTLPTDILRLPWLRFFRSFSSFLRQIPGYTSQRLGTVRTLPN
jgi:hypothetical protein